MRFGRWITGAGATVMKRIAAPMVGGMVSATLLTLMVVPALYALWRGWQLRRAWIEGNDAAVPSGLDSGVGSNVYTEA